MRLRRSNLSRPGYGRSRHGTGFSYTDTAGHRLAADEVQRIKDLVIPPAWKDVWISPDPAGHVQAVGVDDAGRRQYLYHPQWRARRDLRKFRHMREVAGALPRLRKRVTKDLDLDGLPKARVLAAAVRLLDRGLFRVGSDTYAAGDDPTFGVATLTVDHVNRRGASLTFCYNAKGGIERNITIEDARVAAVVRSLERDREPGDRLLAWQDDDRGWHDVHSGDVNEYLRAASGIGMSAKDLRTWHATVLAAVVLAEHDPPTSPTVAKKVVAGVVREVANELGNTPAVARASYIDPIIIDRYTHGDRIPRPARRSGPAVERAVIEFLDE